MVARTKQRRTRMKGIQRSKSRKSRRLSRSRRLRRSRGSRRQRMKQSKQRKQRKQNRRLRRKLTRSNKLYGMKGGAGIFSKCLSRCRPSLYDDNNEGVNEAFHTQKTALISELQRARQQYGQLKQELMYEMERQSNKEDPCDAINHVDDTAARVEEALTRVEEAMARVEEAADRVEEAAARVEGGH